MTVLLSSELCHSRLDVAEAGQLLRAVAEAGALVERVVVYFRDQCSLIESSYAEGVNAGLQWTHADQLGARFYYSHRQVAERWLDAARALTPPPKVVICSYNRHRGDLARHFLGEVGLTDTTGLDLRLVANARGSRAVIETVKRALATDGRVPGYAFADWLKQLDKRPVRSFLDAETRDRIRREFEDENRGMCLALGLDPDDFPACELNDDVDERPLDLDDLTQMLIGAFRLGHPSA